MRINDDRFPTSQRCNSSRQCLSEEPRLPRGPNGFCVYVESRLRANFAWNQFFTLASRRSASSQLDGTHNAPHVEGAAQGSSALAGEPLLQPYLHLEAACRGQKIWHFEVSSPNVHG